MRPSRYTESCSRLPSEGAPSCFWRIRDVYTRSVLGFYEGSIQIQICLGARVRRIMLDHMSPGARAQRGAHCRVAGEGLHEPGHRLRTFREAAGLTVTDDLAVGGDVRDHARYARGHRLEDGVRLAFEDGRMEEHVRGGQIGGDVVPRHLTGEDEAVPDVRVSRLQLSIVAVSVMFLRVTADHDCGGLGDPSDDVQH